MTDLDAICPSCGYKTDYMDFGRHVEDGRAFLFCPACDKELARPITTDELNDVHKELAQEIHEIIVSRLGKITGYKIECRSTSVATLTIERATRVSPPEKADNE